jgi:hypothetical protein
MNGAVIGCGVGAAVQTGFLFWLSEVGTNWSIQDNKPKTSAVIGTGLIFGILVIGLLAIGLWLVHVEIPFRYAALTGCLGVNGPGILVLTVLSYGRKEEWTASDRWSEMVALTTLLSTLTGLGIVLLADLPFPGALLILPPLAFLGVLLGSLVMVRGTAAVREKLGPLPWWFVGDEDKARKTFL